jgi:hypothetical protein
MNRCAVDLIAMEKVGVRLKSGGSAEAIEQKASWRIGEVAEREE